MRRFLESMVCLLLLLVTGCSSTQLPVLLINESVTGIVCTPAQPDMSVGIALDILSNYSDQPVEILDVLLDDKAKDMQLSASQVRKDLDNSCVGCPYNSDMTKSWAPLTVIPGEQVIVDVMLTLTNESYGWTNGLWVIARTDSGQQFKVHTCHTLIVQQPGIACGDSDAEDEYYPTKGPIALCAQEKAIFEIENQKSR